MKIEELTLKQIKEIQSLLPRKKDKKQKDPARKMIGKVCMFRTYSAGVHFGELVEKQGQTCLLKDAQRVFYWVQACSLSQLAMEGSKNFDGCKIAVPVDEIVIEQVIEIIPMPESVVKAFKGAKLWKK